MIKRPVYYFLATLLILVIAAAAACAGAWLWMNQTLRLSAERVDFVVDPGSSPRAVAHTLNAAGIPMWDDGFVWMARLSGRDKLIKAGGYQALQGDSPWRLLERLARGDMTQRQITFV